MISSKTIDSIIPTIVFLISDRLFYLQITDVNAVLFILIIGIIRIINKQTINYALAGLGLVIIASVLAYITESAAGYFIFAIISTSLILLLTLISILVIKN